LQKVSIVIIKNTTLLSVAYSSSCVTGTVFVSILAMRWCSQ